MCRCVPRPCSHAADPALASWVILNCLVSHRIAPGEFLSGGVLYRHLACLVSPSSPSSSAPEGPIVARPSRSVKS